MIIKFFRWLRVHYKLIKCKFVCVNSFCSECGVENWDFHVSDDIWEKVEPYIATGNDVLCYNCFCAYCEKLGLPDCWELTYLEEK